MLQTPTQPNRRRRPLRVAITLAAAGPLLFAACGGSGSDKTSEPEGGASAKKAGAGEVVMELVAYKPENIEVKPGTTVTWQQKDPGVHTVTSGTIEQGGSGVTKQPDGKFDSKEIATGDAFEFTFDEAGTFPYFCSVHPATMRGEIRVS